MATFYANPNEKNEPWIEHAAMDGFRNWHLMFFCFSTILVLFILICCCVKFRIPRTKLEIEGDYRRKQLAEKFQERLRLIQNQDMDALNLQQALKIIQEDFDSENKSINEKVAMGRFPEPEKSVGEHVDLFYVQTEAPQPTKFAKKFANIMLATAIRTQSSAE